MDGCGGGDGAGGGVLSDVEIILPGEVIESLGSLRPDSLSCFMSVDEKAQTTKQLFVHKLSDNSVRIRVTGSNRDRLTALYSPPTSRCTYRHVDLLSAFNRADRVAFNDICGFI